MTPEKIQFTKEKETMLMTLSGRAIQSQWKDPILRDPWAEEAMRHIDYDLSEHYKGIGSWSMWSEIGCTVIATRAATFDLLHATRIIFSMLGVVTYFLLPEPGQPGPLIPGYKTANRNRLSFLCTRPK